MKILLWLTAVGTLILEVYLQYQYARAGYPESRQWRLLLFTSGFLAVAIGGAAVTAVPSSVQEVIVLLGFAAALGGLGFGFLFPINMQNIIPKWKDGE